MTLKQLFDELVEMKKLITKMDELIRESDILIKSLGWTTDQARQHLINNFNKKSRALLTPDEWADYLKKLKYEKLASTVFPCHNRSDLINEVDTELTKLGWKTQELTKYLVKTYKKLQPKSLTPEEMKEFIDYLRSQKKEE